MAENSKIGWTHHTMNFHWGCNRVSEECRFCYIEPIMKRSGHAPFNGPTRTVNWSGPRKWNRQAKENRRRHRVFTCSMSDFFHPGADEWRDEAWDVIRECGNLDWLVLTKRPELIMDRLPMDWGDGWRNVWLGVTCGVRKSLRRVEMLCDIPAAIRFISAEPLLEAIDFRRYLNGQIHWIITGCERAHKNKRRLMSLDWVRDIDQQCREAHIAHFFKQCYVDNQGAPVEDGVLDGARRQKFPVTQFS